MNPSPFFLTTVAAAIGLFTLLRNLRFHQEDKEKDSSSLSPPSCSSPPSVASSSLSRKQTHHVFASFHGEDVRRDFFSHVQMEFLRKGITLFNDNEITRGESIGPELIQAIKGSKVVIVLLSRNYASSRWCLGELVEIMKCREEVGQIVLTIFYKVDPSDIKNLTGGFGKVFRKTCAGKSKEDKGRWRQALGKVATIAGYHSRNWDNEAAMIKEIATDISNKLNYSISSSDFDGLVGMRAHLEKMKPLLCLDSDDVRMIGIWGPPGIGKTTIARVAFNQLCNSFQLSVFMNDINAKYTRPCSDDYNTKLELQQQFMSQITNHKDMEVSHLGVAQDRLKDKKVLVVLDGVDQLVQLDAVAKEAGWFGPGSRIIITTQDHQLFRAHGINHIYKVDFPPSDEALQIFCMNAFDQKSPKDGFEKLAWKVTTLASQLPLGLRVMGSYFKGMPKQEWKKSLPRLETRLNVGIQSILKFSYDALDDEDKDLFLHIGCFFNGTQIEKVEELLAEKFSEVRQRLYVLKEKSLISIDFGYVAMHSLLIKLGRGIVREQSIDEPGQRQFLVDRREICEVLTGDVAGSTSVIGIDFNYLVEEKIDMSERAFEGMSNLKFLRVTGGYNCDTLQLPRGLNYFPGKLRLLHWNDFPLTCLPSILSLDFLVELIMWNSKLEKLWEGIKSLRNLKRMFLSSSVHLKELPDLSTATNLQELILRDCSSLVKLPSTNGYTNNLRELDLFNCSSLIRLPSSIGDATNLEKLLLGGCSSLVEFPSFIWNLINLQILDLSSFPNLVKLPSSIGNATSLKQLDLSDCLNLVELPLSIGNLHKLLELILKGCAKLEVLPTNINLESLSKIDVTDCTILKSFPEISTNVKCLLLSGTAIEEVPPSIRFWPHLEFLEFSYFENLKGIRHAVDIDITIALHLSDKMIQEVPPWVKRISRLDRLVIKGCRKLVSLPQIPDSLWVIDAAGCESLERLDCSFQKPKYFLNFAKCFKLNQEARDLIIQTSISAVLPGREVPSYFTYRAISGDSLTVKLNERPRPTSMRFMACILLVNKGENEACDDERSLDLGFNVMCRKIPYWVHPVLTEHLYTFQVYAEVTSSELVFEFKVRDDWKIEDCGLLQL